MNFKRIKEKMFRMLINKKATMNSLFIVRINETNWFRRIKD